MVEINNLSNILNSVYVNGIHKDAFGLSHSLKNLDGYRAERLKKLRAEEKELETQLMPIQGRIEVLKEFREFLTAAKHSLFKPDGSSLHKLIEDGIAHRVHGHRESVDTQDLEGAYWRYIRDNAQVFVIEHDWAAALGSGVSEGEFVFPYECCVFEMVVSGVRVIYAHDAITNDGIFVRFKKSWAGVVIDPNEAQGEQAGKFILSQIRAVCISLDAEVATAPVTRAPYALNAAREKRGALPLYDFHVVSLNRKPRLAPLDEHTPGRKCRLHFRRGHWRHYDGHKTWIKWMLVGDPDLGFVDKHYRA